MFISLVPGSTDISKSCEFCPFVKETTAVNYVIYRVVNLHPYLWTAAGARSIQAEGVFPTANEVIANRIWRTVPENAFQLFSLK